MGPALPNGEVEVIDATDMIVMPGFVDSHRHIWEGLLRNIGTDVPLEGRTSYISFVLHKLAPAFRPEDVRRQPGLGARGDRCGYHDAARLVAHPGLARPHRRGDPGAERLRAPCGLRAGSRGGGSGRSVNRAGSSEPPPSTSRRRTRSSPSRWRHRSEFTDFEVTRDHWKLARETDARITTHVGVGSYGQDGKVQEFGEGGLLGRTPRTSTAPRSTTPRSR